MNWNPQTPDDRWREFAEWSQRDDVPPTELAKFELVEEQYRLLDAFVTWLECQNQAVAQIGAGSHWTPCDDVYDVLYEFLGVDREALAEERDGLAKDTWAYINGQTDPQALPVMVRVLAWEDQKRRMRDEVAA